MKKYGGLLVLLIVVSLFIQGCDRLLSDKEQERVLSPFESVWVNDKNVCDSITISRQGENFLFSRDGKKYPASLENELLNVFFEVESKVMIDDSGILVFQGSEYNRFNPLISSELLTGEFTVFNCEEELRGSVEIDTNQNIQIYAYAYAEVNGKLKSNGDNSYSVFYEAAYGSISFHGIHGADMNHVNKEKPIARINVLSDDYIQFEWLGISLSNSKEDYLMKTLSDNSLWCESPNWGVQSCILKRRVSFGQ
jgi:hypothetical protein